MLKRLLDWLENMWKKIKEFVRSIKRNIPTLYYCLKDPRTPTIPKVLSGFVVVYALSPIDLIPYFIPILGALDDFINRV